LLWPAKSPKNGGVMRCSTLLSAAALLTFSATASAAIFSFDTDPFAGSTALTDPGRQIVGGEPFINFDPAMDVFEFSKDVFGIDEILFFSGLATDLPGSGVNFIVLQNADVPFGAGIAANLTAAEITQPGPGFFIYFNSGLDLARLVYSTNLDDSTADLKIMARMTNLSGQAGRDALPEFTEANFVLQVPEPSSLLLLTAGALGFFGVGRLKPRA
jgi:hypothetical protein